MFFIDQIGSRKTVNPLCVGLCAFPPTPHPTRLSTYRGCIKSLCPRSLLLLRCSERHAVNAPTSSGHCQLNNGPTATLQSGTVTVTVMNRRGLLLKLTHIMDFLYSSGLHRLTAQEICIFPFEYIYIYIHIGRLVNYSLSTFSLTGWA